MAKVTTDEAEEGLQTDLDPNLASSVEAPALQAEKASTIRSTVRWSFRVMIAMTFLLLGYGLFWPGGPEILNALLGLIITFYTSFTGIVGVYIGARTYLARKGFE